MTLMPTRHDHAADEPQTGRPLAPDAEASPDATPLPIPGAAGPMGGSPTGELIDGADQPIASPGTPPPLATDQD
jgi:hypothetical protein